MTVDERSLDEVAAFHGHVCPGLAMGIQAARIALREIGPHSKDEEVVAVVETDMCGVDAIQVMTGCTFGKGNLVHHDWGKNAYTFYRRSDGRAVRIAGRPDAWTRDPEHQDLLAKIRSRTASEQERERFSELHAAQSYRVLEMEPDALFTVTPVTGQPPAKARIHASALCAACGENVMETRLRRFAGVDYCQPCFETVLATG